MKRKVWITLALVVCMSLIAFVIAGQPPQLLKGYKAKLVTGHVEYFQNYSLVRDIVSGRSDVHAVQLFTGKVTGISMASLTADLENRYRPGDGWRWVVTPSDGGADGPNGDVTLSPRADGAVGVTEAIVLSWPQVMWLRLTHLGSSPFQQAPDWP